MPVLALLTAEQEMLKEMAGQLADDVGLANPSDLEKVDRQKGWASLADAGLLALRTRDATAAPGLGGRGDAGGRRPGRPAGPPALRAPTCSAAELLCLAGAPAGWIDELADGTTRYRPRPRPPTSPGLADAADLADAVAWDAEEARYGLALAGPPDARQVVRVALAGAFTRVEGADLTRPLLRARLGRRPTSSPPAGPSTAAEYDRWLALALTVVSADMVGAMRHGLGDVVEYAKQRIQYGVPIGSFQAVQHLCAEMLVAVEGADSTVKYAAWAVDELEPAEALLAARTAKAYTAHSARAVPETIMQVYGGIGQTWEHIAHFINRRALLDRALFGDDDVQLLAIADARLAGELTWTTATPPRRPPSGPSCATGWPSNAPQGYSRHRGPGRAQQGLPPVPPLALRGRLHGHGVAGRVRRAGGSRPIYDAILNEEAGVGGCPPIPGMVNYLGRSIYTYGSEDQKREFLPTLLTGDTSWCQGFSEPDAGSDIGSLRTRADLARRQLRRQRPEDVDQRRPVRRDGACCSPAPTARPPSTGASPACSSSMKSPGITVRPIVLANGDPETCEVFWDNVEVPASAHAGPAGTGLAWWP